MERQHRLGTTRYTYTHNVTSQKEPPVPQITLYLDREAIRVMRQHAAAARIPYSRWVAALIRRQSTEYWRPDITSIFGAHRDMPNPSLPVFGGEPQASARADSRQDSLPERGGT